MDLDSTINIVSVDVSLVTSDRVELVSVYTSRVYINYEVNDFLSCVYFQVFWYQLDSQLDNPPFPVALWANVPAASSCDGGSSEEKRTIAVEVKRLVSNSGILMMKSLSALLLMKHCVSL